MAIIIVSLESALLALGVKVTREYHPEDNYDWEVDAMRQYDFALELARDGHEGVRGWFTRS